MKPTELKRHNKPHSKVYSKIKVLISKLTLPEKKLLLNELYLEIYFKIYDQHHPVP